MSNDPVWTDNNPDAMPAFRPRNYYLSVTNELSGYYYYIGTIFWQSTNYKEGNHAI